MTIVLKCHLFLSEIFYVFPDFPRKILEHYCKFCMIWNSHSNDYEEFYIWDITLPSSLKMNRRFGRTCRLLLEGRRTRETRNQHEAGGLHNFQRTKMRYIPRDGTLHCRKLSTIPSFYSLFSSLSVEYPTTRHYIAWASHSFVKSVTNV
jgi:hypothetical protein